MGNDRIVPGAELFFELVCSVIGSFWANLRPAMPISSEASPDEPIPDEPSPAGPNAPKLSHARVSRERSLTDPGPAALILSRLSPNQHR